MRRFELHDPNTRFTLVAEGVVFSDGKVALRWLGHWSSIEIHEHGLVSMDHLHREIGKAELVWVDSDLYTRMYNRIVDLTTQSAEMRDKIRKLENANGR